MSIRKEKVKLYATLAMLPVILLGGYLYITKVMPRPEKKQKKKQECPPCKCEKCKGLPKVSPTDLQKIIRSNAKSFYQKWNKECANRKAFVNVMSCIRWGKLRKYLSKDYADQVMVVRRMIGHLILDRIGQELCSNRDKPFVKNELKAQGKNTKENLRRLKKIIHHKPSLKMPTPKKCRKKNGKFIWAPP